MWQDVLKAGNWILGTLIALLIAFDGSKQILNLSFVSLTVRLLHQAVGSYCRHILCLACAFVLGVVLGWGTSNICGNGIGSGCIDMSLTCELSAVRTGVQASMWGFWTLTALGGDPTEWTSSARIFTSPRLTRHSQTRGGRLSLYLCTSQDMKHAEVVPCCGLNQ